LRFDECAARQCIASFMSWLKFEMHLGGLDAGRVEDALQSAGALSVTFEDAGDSPIYQPGAEPMPLWNDTRITGLFPAGIDVRSVCVSLLATLGIEQVPSYRIELLEDREWVREWLKDLKPMRFGERLWVYPSTFVPADISAVNVLLDPGLAFGTGNHASTALCLEWLDSADLRGKTVIDYGCGSGILAIAAVRLGAKRVWAVDTDPQALTATRENAGRNQMTTLEVTPPEELTASQVDVVLANILAGTLVELAPRFAALVRTGGNLLLSGILSSQRDEIQAAYATLFKFSDGAQRQEWLRMDGVRRENR
jgi:ribosomal protein L11 methyltransferase